MSRLLRATSRLMNEEAGRSQGSWLPGSFHSGGLPHYHLLIPGLSHLTSSQPIRGKGERSQRQPQNTCLLCAAGVWLHVLVKLESGCTCWSVPPPGCIARSYFHGVLGMTRQLLGRPGPSSFSVSVRVGLAAEPCSTAPQKAGSPGPEGGKGPDNWASC